jgi:hemoglobin
MDTPIVVAHASTPATTAGAVTEQTIRLLVDQFYTKVRADRELGPIFERVIGDDWEAHLATMRDFWSSVMLTTGRYKGNPVAAHLRIEAIEPRLFDRWLDLFARTCHEQFDETVAAAFTGKAARIAESLKLTLFDRLRLPPRRRPPHGAG